jgi:hypothetical protein
MGEKAYIDRLVSNAQLGVPSGSFAFTTGAWGGVERSSGAAWGWVHHHIVSKVQSFKLENHLSSCFNVFGH